MAQVSLPMADWDSIDVLLQDLENRGWIVQALREAILSQVATQED